MNIEQFMQGYKATWKQRNEALVARHAAAGVAMTAHLAWAGLAIAAGVALVLMPQRGHDRASRAATAARAGAARAVRLPVAAALPR